MNKTEITNNNNYIKINKKVNLRLKINNGRESSNKKGKKFFKINKNSETLKGYLQYKPFDLNEFVSQNPSFFNYKNSFTEIIPKNKDYSDINKTTNFYLNGQKIQKRKIKPLKRYYSYNRYNIRYRYIKCEEKKFCQIRKKQIFMNEYIKNKNISNFLK